jgi:Protein of unknown function (DUF2510)
MLAVSNELLVIGVAWFAALIPVTWAIVDVVRRPAWQFTAGRKVAWALTLGIGWLVPYLFPFTLVAAIVYLVAIRRRLPPAAAGPSPGWGTGTGPAAPGTPYGFSGASPYAPNGVTGVTTAPPAPTRRDLPDAGWYPDPAGGGGQRWWDGVGWTDHTRPGG